MRKIPKSIILVFLLALVWISGAATASHLLQSYYKAELEYAKEYAQWQINRAQAEAERDCRKQTDTEWDGFQYSYQKLQESWLELREELVATRKENKALLQELNPEWNVINGGR